MSYSTSAGVATITLDHLGSRNAISRALLGDIGDGMARAVADPSVRVVVLTHTGPAFCAGADLDAGGVDRAVAHSRGRASTEAGIYDMAAVLDAIMDSPKPVVARIAGLCAGGGVGLAAAADVSIAAEGAHFVLSEVRLGMAPAIISVVCLPKLRRGDALELFLTGERIGATRAAAVGLISRAVPPADLDASVDTIVQSLIAGAPGALGAAKSLVYDVPGMERADAFAATIRLTASLSVGEEARAGMAAFTRGETPPWVPQ